jgi:very-short-patch-repair endonuclease
MNHFKKSYEALSKIEKLTLIQDLYVKEKLSFADIASMHDTYANKVRRDAKAFNIKIRSKSEAQKNALDTGKHGHPTKGKPRSENTKSKIGNKVMKFWEDLDDAALQQRKEKFKENWLKLSEDEKKHMQKLATDAVRASSKLGSKLEKFLLQKLIEKGYKVDFHKEQSLLTTKLQIDLFLPNINTAIEIDGPSHFLPVWGEDALQKNIKYDRKKQGLIIGKGLVLIRIKQTKDFCQTRANLVFDQLDNLLQIITNNFPKPEDRNFTIED